MSAARRPVVISHAACAGRAPENTLAGIRIALELRADAIEVDVQASADGVPVLMHDLTVDRTTDGRGAVAALTLAELRRLDAGTKVFQGAFRGERVPTLAEALALTKGKAVLVAEIKQPGIEAQVAEVIRQAQAVNAAMVWSFFPQVLEAIAKVEPRLPAALLVAEATAVGWPALIDMTRRLRARAISVYHQSLTPAMIQRAQQRALTVYTWTVDTEEEMKRLLAAGVDGIVTNDPARLLRVIGEHQAA